MPGRGIVFERMTKKKQMKVSELPSGNSKTDLFYGGKPELDPRKHTKLLLYY